MTKEALLSYFPKITYKRYQDLLRVFSSLENVWQAPLDDFAPTGWDITLTHEFLLWRDTLDQEKIQQILERESVTCIPLHDPAYPEQLKHIYDPPLCLFIRGKTTFSEFSLAVVGTRKNTLYGKQVTQEFVSTLARAGITIVSGLALGIDGIAHSATLDAGGTTVAVLGGGVDTNHIQPSMHRGLADSIIQKGGTVLSEYPPGTVPTKFTFPRRNRIIAGLSLGTLVIEAGQTSGALITAQCSLDANRDVFAIPQNITSQTSIGTNSLLKSGAHLVTSPQDILDILDLKNVKQIIENRDIVPDSPIEATLLEHISRDPLHVDEIIKHSRIDSSTVMSTLTLMEMKGMVKNVGAMMYVRSR